MNRLIGILALTLAFGFAPRAEAAFLNGSIEYDLLDASLDCGVDFDGCATTVLNDGGTVGTDSTGDFATLTSGVVQTDATIAPFTYDPPTFPVTPFVSFLGLDANTYSFYITSFTVTEFANGIVVLDGLGYWGANAAYQQTAGGFTLTGSRSGNPDIGFSYDVGGTLEAFNRDVPDTPVPEPGSMILLGTGLMGLAASARRRMRRKDQ